MVTVPPEFRIVVLCDLGIFALLNRFAGVHGFILPHKNTLRDLLRTRCQMGTDCSPVDGSCQISTPMGKAALAGGAILGLGGSIHAKRQSI